MKIIGAGMAGMLAGQYFRSRKPVILERQKELPNNHAALLRFRNKDVSELTGIPFKEVIISKAINYGGTQFTESNILFNNLYSHKVTGVHRSRSLMNTNSTNNKRYIAPPDFIQLLSNGLDILYDRKCDIETLTGDDIVISTMPVASLAMILKYDLKTKLITKPIWTIKFDIPSDIRLYQTIYYPNPGLPVYRISITEKTVIAEFVTEPQDEYLELIKHFLALDFGIESEPPSEVDIKFQKQGKLVPCETSAVKDFIGWATRQHNIYSLGRWGTHRQILLDDVVQDIKVIDKLIRHMGYIT